MFQNKVEELYNINFNKNHSIIYIHIKINFYFNFVKKRKI